MKQYTVAQIEHAKDKILEVIEIINDLENTFEGRHFTMDGHLIGSIGEVMAAYYYGIDLYDASMHVHDGIALNGKEVQIKITQTDRVLISEEPEHLIVLFLDRKSGNIKEVYNGPGKVPYEKAYYYKKHNNRYMMISMLLNEDKVVEKEQRIPMIHELEKYTKKSSMHSSNNIRQNNTTTVGYINKNQQENLGLSGGEGTLVGQKSYKIRCRHCGYEYEANGCDIWQRKCQKCQV